MSSEAAFGLLGVLAVIAGTFFAATRRGSLLRWFWGTSLIVLFLLTAGFGTLLIVNRDRAANSEKKQLQRGSGAQSPANPPLFESPQPTSTPFLRSSQSTLSSVAERTQPDRSAPTKTRLKANTYGYDPSLPDAPIDDWTPRITSSPRTYGYDPTLPDAPEEDFPPSHRQCFYYVRIQNRTPRRLNFDILETDGSSHTYSIPPAEPDRLPIQACAANSRAFKVRVNAGGPGSRMQGESTITGVFVDHLITKESPDRNYPPLYFFDFNKSGTIQLFSAAK